jgi:hypothetical protein
MKRLVRREPMPSRRIFLGTMLGVPVALVVSARADDDEAEKRAKSVNNMKQIALAFHNYHSSNNKFPASAINSDEGKPLLSWRVAILPFLEQQALYDEFHKDEPWDSEHNKALIEKMPEVYASVLDKEGEKFKTYYQGFKGPGAFFEGDEGLPIASFTDGTSNTIMIVEAAKPVTWTKPMDLTLDEDKEKPLPKLGGLFESGFDAAFADGSVKFLKKDIDPDLLRKVITRNGGEVISADDF